MTPYFSYPRDSVGAEIPDSTVAQGSSAVCQTALMTCVSDSDVELERLIDEGADYFQVEGAKSRAESEAMSAEGRLA